MRICKDLQGFDETLGEYSQGFMKIRKDSQGFVRLWEKICKDLEGFARFWESICEDLQNFGRGFTRIYQTLGEDLQD